MDDCGKKQKDMFEGKIQKVKMRALCEQIRSCGDPSRMLSFLHSLLEKLYGNPLCAQFQIDWLDMIANILKSFTCGRVLNATCTLLALLCQLECKCKVLNGGLEGVLKRGVLHQLLGIIGARQESHCEEIDLQLITTITGLLQYLSAVIRSWPSNLLESDVHMLLDLCCPLKSPVFRKKTSSSGCEQLAALSDGKKLIGEMCLLSEHDAMQCIDTQMSPVNIDSKKLYMCKQVYLVNLFDTTQEDVDVNIGEEMLKQNAVWPSTTEKLTTTQIYQDVSVASIVNGCTFWAHIGGKKTYTALSSIKKIIEDCPDDKKIRLRRQPRGGEFVCGCVDSNGHFRGQALAPANPDRTDYCRVFLTDQGCVIDVKWEALWLQVPDMGLKKFPPQATLCQLKRYITPPSDKKLLLNTVRTLANMLETRRVNLGAFPLAVLPEKLMYLCHCGDVQLQAAVLILFGNLSFYKFWKRKLGHTGLIRTICGICEERQNKEEDCVLRAALFALNNLLFDCLQNKAYFKETKGLSVLLHWYWRGGSAVKAAALCCLRVLVGNAIFVDIPMKRGSPHFPRKVEELPPVQHQRNANIRPRQRSRSRSRGRSSSSNPSDDDMAPLRRSLSEEQLEAVATIALSNSEDEENAENSDYGNGSESPEDPSKIGYVYNGLVPFQNDNFHEIRPNKKIQHVSAKTISKIVCAFLNQGCGGSIIFGISECGRVAGIDVDRDTRDELRIGIDKEMQRLIPPVLPQLYTILFKKVIFHGTVDIPLPVRARQSHYYTIELNIEKTCGVAYTYCGKVYMRCGAETRDISQNDLHTFSVQQCEKAYLEDMEYLEENIKRFKQELGDDSSSK